MSNIYLLLYISAWSLLAYSKWKSKKTMSASVFVLMCYSFFAIMSYLLYNDPEQIYVFKELEFFPFLYLFVMLYIASIPIRKFDSCKVYSIQEPTMWKLNLFAGLFIFTSLLSLPALINNVQKIPMLLLDSSVGLTSYRESIEIAQANKAGTISNLPAIINGLYSKLGALLLFYYLTLEKRNNWIIGGLIYALFSWMLSFMISGQRGGIFHTSICLLASYFLLRRFLSERMNRIIKKIGIISIVLITLPTIALTISRFGDESNGVTNTQSSLYYYMGQCNLYFNNFGLDDNGIRYGDRTLTLLKKAVGFDNVPLDFWEGRQKYPNLYIGDEVFSSFVGDFTIDFGPILAFFMFLSFTLLANKHIKPNNGILPFHRFILIFIILDVCVDGAMFLFPYAYLGNLTLIFYILTIIFFKLDYNQQIKKYKPYGKV